MLGNIIFAVFGAVVGAVIAAFVVPTYISPQLEPTPTPLAQDEAMQMPAESEQGMNMREMTDELSQLEGGEFDLAFLELMIEHHQDAIDMSELVGERSENVELQDLATDIQETQAAEITQMQEWQAAWATQSAELAE
ncbi:MAG: DUF305 domain-containing protein [Patescibacteria group bacterium]